MSRLDLNIDLDAVARRLSFSHASPPQPQPQPPSRPRAPPRSHRRRPPLPPIAEDPGEQQAAAETQTPARPLPWTTSSSPLRPLSQAPSSALQPAPYETPVVAYAPPAATIGPVFPAPSVSPFQPREAVAAALSRELVRRREAQLRMQQQAWASAAAQSQPQRLRLYTVEGNPAGYETKWEELHPMSQELLLQIDRAKIREYRHDSEQLDQCSRLYDPSVPNRGFELDASQITQEIGSISTIMDREKASIQNLMAVVREMMCNTDFAIHSYVKLRPRFVHRGAEIANHAGSSGTSTDFNQPLTMAPAFRCYRGAVRRPSLVMQHTVARFEKQLEECCKLIRELEQLVQMKHGKSYPDALESLPKIMSNMHDYFIHVAAKVENLCQYAQTMRTQYLNDQRHRGNWNDPFLEADRKEAAKQETSARNLQFSSRCRNA